ncbi:Polyprenol-phosphate-mannose-dependent alpha-(1-2)-phosphatidylinositol mannoside mannosyltransferase [Corynebacterium oculi]|uniref:Polyprenol-phosphate-mannose-dependent alpha-(1-2)-phosphatidylinositol mannoside mannosyltransferase n=1 Tax=Corynebacterium oculi TaxID=1544416 RepID=A0A0Q0UBE5_9CORY|nr:Polyprenol-phosphate-mannose-dependent alpha-(1-2)-phosphatidylinositol mannoside mannosyltransferase [Corynebacterium oculi]
MAALPATRCAYNTQVLDDKTQAAPRLIAPPRWAQYTGAALLLLVTALTLFQGAFHLRYFLDFEVYRAGTQAFLHGESIYERDYDMGIVTLPFTYPPFAALLFAPLAWLPSALGAVLLFIINAACIWWVMVLTLRWCAPRLSAPAWAACVLPLVLLSEPVRETLLFGQINVILMAIVCTDILGRRLPLPRGVLVGLAAAIKLTPAVFGLYFLVKRDWRAAGWAVGSGLGFTALAALISPHNSRVYWLDTLSNTGRIGSPFYASNQSLQGFLYRMEVPPEVLSVVWVVGSILCVALVTWAMHRLLHVGAVPAALVVNSLIALICSPISWTHHWVWLIPALIVTGAAARTHRALGALAVAIAAAILAAPHWLLPTNDGRELDWPLWALPLGNAYLVLALLLLGYAAIFPRHFAPAQAPIQQR